MMGRCALCMMENNQVGFDDLCKVCKAWLVKQKKMKKTMEVV